MGLLRVDMGMFWLFSPGGGKGVWLMVYPEAAACKAVLFTRLDTYCPRGRRTRRGLQCVCGGTIYSMASMVKQDKK
jgi:hypothetical protein